jgi:hypothetical protein
LSDVLTARPLPRFSDYIVFVDESGDHSLESINPDWPVFVLSFCVLHRAEYIEKISPALRNLKFDTFGHDLVVLHEHDIVKRLCAFAQLNKPARDAFLGRLTDIMDTASITMIFVVIDKLKHKKRYSQPEHPYHLAMQFGLERIALFLDNKGQGDRETWIVCEARGKKEDDELELHFRRMCEELSGKHRKPLPLHIYIADKKSNCEGLQLADLTARPAGLHVLRPAQPNRAWDVMRSKLFTSRNGKVTGYGLKVFP